MMKARLGNGSPELIPVPVLLFLECHNQIKGTLRDLARTGRDYARVALAFRYSDSAFMRVRGKIFDVA